MLSNKAKQWLKHVDPNPILTLQGKVTNKIIQKSRQS